MVSAKISQGKEPGKHNLISVEKYAIFILWTLSISEIYEAGFETVILPKHMNTCNCLELRIFSKNPSKLHVLVYSLELRKKLLQ